MNPKQWYGLCCRRFLLMHPVPHLSSKHPCVQLQTRVRLLEVLAILVAPVERVRGTKWSDDGSMTQVCSRYCCGTPVIRAPFASVDLSSAAALYLSNPVPVLESPQGSNDASQDSGQPQGTESKTGERISPTTPGLGVLLSLAGCSDTRPSRDQIREAVWAADACAHSSVGIYPAQSSFCLVHHLDFTQKLKASQNVMFFLEVRRTSVIFRPRGGKALRSCSSWRCSPVAG